MVARIAELEESLRQQSLTRTRADRREAMYRRRLRRYEVTTDSDSSGQSDIGPSGADEGDGSE